MAEKKTVRPNQSVAVRHPEHGGYVVPDRATAYPVDDPLVRAYPWLFSTEEELARQESTLLRESAPIEQATRAPGEKRATRRAR